MAGTSGCILTLKREATKPAAANVLQQQGRFDAFVTERLDARGTGLGLTVAEGIITQHGGAITASNRPQGGACLEVSLPAAL